jgi:hypothetical protein
VVQLVGYCGAVEVDDGAWRVGEGVGRVEGGQVLLVNPKPSQRTKQFVDVNLHGLSIQSVGG